MVNSRRGRPRTDPLARLMSRAVRFPDGCLLFTGSATTAGNYPSIGEGDQTSLGYHVVFERAYGKIPEGKEVHHRCEQSMCLEQTHLVALTPEEHWLAHGNGAPECRVCGAQDWYIKPDGKRRCRPCRRATRRRVYEETGCWL